MSRPLHPPEIDSLLAALNAQRRHVLGIIDGLPDAALRQPVLPTAWTCLGLVRHLALDVEQFWFQAVTAGEPFDLDRTDEEVWQVRADETAASILDLYRHEIERANIVIAATAPDAAPAWWPDDMFGDFRLHNLREIVLHVITETACHAGHLDAARELLDGRTWFIATG